MYESFACSRNPWFSLNVGLKPAVFRLPSDVKVCVAYYRCCAHDQCSTLPGRVSGDTKTFAT